MPSVPNGITLSASTRPVLTVLLPRSPRFVSGISVHERWIFFPDSSASSMVGRRVLESIPITLSFFLVFIWSKDTPTDDASRYGISSDFNLTAYPRWLTIKN